MIEVLRKSSLYFFHLGLLVLIAGLPSSTFLTSLAQFILVGAWVLKLDFPRQWVANLKKKEFWALSSVFWIFLLSAFWTQHTDLAMGELRILLPFFILPWVLLGFPRLSKQQTQGYFLLYIISVSISAAIALPGLWDYYQGQISDTRQAFRHISHIRFALNLCLAIFLGFYLLQESRRFRWWLLPLLLLLIVFALMMQSPTAVIIGIGTAIVCLVALLPSRKRWWGIAGVGLITLILTVWVYNLYCDFSIPKEDKRHFKTQTALGNAYEHHFSSTIVENGYYVYCHLQREELEVAWPKRSQKPLNGLDGKQQPLWQTLVRYLNSKGLTKDAEGLSQLSDKEIKWIEQGITNAVYAEHIGIKPRFYQFFWEVEMIKDGGTLPISGILLKWTLWEAAIHIWLQSPWIGVGTGNLERAFKAYYEKHLPELDNRLRLKSHQQFLSLLATTGILGFLLFALATGWLINKKHFHYFPALAFLCIALMSLLSEDTWNTQAGASFYAFFQAFFVLSACSFSCPPKAPSTTSTNSPFKA